MAWMRFPCYWPFVMFVGESTGHWRFYNPSRQNGTYSIFEKNMDQLPISLIIFHHNCNSMKLSVDLLHIIIQRSLQKIAHGSCAVVACAKLCCDMTVRIGITPKRFPPTLNCDGKSLLGWVLGMDDVWPSARAACVIQTSCVVCGTWGHHMKWTSCSLPGQYGQHVDNLSQRGLKKWPIFADGVYRWIWVCFDWNSQRVQYKMPDIFFSGGHCPENIQHVHGRHIRETHDVIKTQILHRNDVST